MGEFFSDREIERWQERALRERGRDQAPEPNTRVISMQEADEMLRQASGGGGGSVSQQILRELKDMNSKLDRLGTIA